MGWLPMGAYPQGVTLMRNRHVVIGIHRNFYDAALWVFDTTTGAERTTVPIPVDPGSGYVSEQSLLVASDVAGTVLLWTEGDFRLLTADPSVSPPGRPSYLTRAIRRGWGRSRSRGTSETAPRPRARE